MKIGDRLGGIEFISSNDGTNTFICSCGEIFSRRQKSSKNDEMMPRGCRECVKLRAGAFSVAARGIELREYTPIEAIMIENFENKAMLDM